MCWCNLLLLYPSGMMELSYTQHYSTTGHAQGPSTGGSPSSSSSSHAGLSDNEQPVDITFTATASASGSLLIGALFQGGFHDRVGDLTRQIGELWSSSGSRYLCSMCVYLIGKCWPDVISRSQAGIQSVGCPNQAGCFVQAACCHRGVEGDRAVRLAVSCLPCR